MKVISRCRIYLYGIMMVICMCCAITINSGYVTAQESDNTPVEMKRVVNLRRVTQTSDEIKVEWDKLSGVTGYEIWKLNKLTNGYDIIGETTECAYKIKELEAGTAVSLLVRPYLGEEAALRQYGMFSDVLYCGTIPAGVNKFQAACSGSSIVVLEWETVSEDASYLIFRQAEGESEYSQIANISSNNYMDTTVKPATGYHYKVVSYVNDTAIRSETEAVTSIATSPKQTYINQYKGGSECVRLRWQKLTAGDGYYILMRNIYGTYDVIADIKDITAQEYIHRNLLAGTSYHYMITPYKIFEGVYYLAQPSNEVDVKATVIKPTSTKAAIYKNNTKLKKSSLYKKYNLFAKALNLKKTYIAPGIKNTSINGFASSNMVIQAVTFAGKYMLMTAYDGKSEENSVVYVIDKKTKKYITTIVLPGRNHVGGIAYDGYNIWVSTGSTISCFTYADVKAAVACGEDYYPVTYKTTCPILTKASFVTYYNGMLWIGEHKETANGKMYGYTINSKKGTPTLTKNFYMTVPSRTQDVLFLKNGTMIVSVSNQVSAKASKYYISCLRRYKPAWGKKKKGTVKLGKCTGSFTMPPMMEGIAYKSGILYVSFESASMASCPYKMDRICALKYSKIKWK